MNNIIIFLTATILSVSALAADSYQRVGNKILTYSKNFVMETDSDLKSELDIPKVLSCASEQLGPIYDELKYDKGSGSISFRCANDVEGNPINLLLVTNGQGPMAIVAMPNAIPQDLRLIKYEKINNVANLIIRTKNSKGEDIGLLLDIPILAEVIHKN